MFRLVLLGHHHFVLRLFQASREDLLCLVDLVSVGNRHGLADPKITSRTWSIVRIAIADALVVC